MTQIIDLRKLRAEWDTIEAPEFPLGTQSGRAVSDERGNMIWEWQTAPGVYTREVTPQELHKLSAIDLELVDHPDLEEPVHWSRKRIVPRTNTRTRNEKNGAFDFFLKKLGLPA
jgi:hypothetical protein